jgi:hypothetical protein
VHPPARRSATKLDYGVRVLRLGESALQAADQQVRLLVGEPTIDGGHALDDGQAAQQRRGAALGRWRLRSALGSGRLRHTLPPALAAIEPPSASR